MDEEEKLNLEIPIDDPNQVVLHKELFLESSSQTREVRIEVEYLDFNFCDYGRTSEFKEVVIHNDSPFWVWINWVANDTSNSLGQIVANPFIFKEQEIFIEANSSHST